MKTKTTTKKGLTASPTLGFPGGSLGREGGRGGGGGGVGLTDDGVAGRTGEEEPEEARKKHKRDSFNYSVWKTTKQKDRAPSALSKKCCFIFHFTGSLS